jgi:small subunit ribosomal protein S16
MPVKIRLQRKGRKQRPFYHIVVADARSPRDGRFIERLGTYNPMTKPATIDIDRQRAYEWLTQGAQPTDTVRAILRFKGVFYRKHLMRGVTKGALTQEEADKKWEEWIEAKEAKIASRREATAAEREEARLTMLGTAPVIEEPVVEEEPVEEAAAPAEEAEAAAEEADTTEAPAAEAPEEAPAKEAPAAEEAPAEEAPAEEEKKDEA